MSESDYTEDGKRIVVIAGNRRQFKDWCRARSLNPNLTLCVTSAYESSRYLRGYRGDVSVVRVGTWYELRDLRQIEDTIRYSFRSVEWT